MKSSVSFDLKCINYRELLMSALAPTDIKSTTKEAGFLELAQLLQTAEQNFVPPSGEVQQNRVQVAINTDTKTATISATLELTSAVSATGQIQFSAVEYC